MLDADITDSVIGEGCVIKASFSKKFIFFPTPSLLVWHKFVHISWQRYLNE
jgi:hypothetical protein